MMPAARQPHLSFEDWLAIERTATDQCSEYLAGEVFAVAGGTEEHNLIVLNVGAELRNQLKGRPCRVYPSDMKVHIVADGVGTYPSSCVCRRASTPSAWPRSRLVLQVPRPAL
jgi:Uma2 family endonuclease